MSAEVMFNRETHKSRGFGFIVFELEKGAEQVCAEQEHSIDGKVVSMKFIFTLFCNSNRVIQKNLRNYFYLIFSLRLF
jgi:RNA recognition motif-containing protein